MKSYLERETGTKKEEPSNNLNLDIAVYQQRINRIQRRTSTN